MTFDSPGLITKKFYAAEQGPQESLITYAARIEELFAQAMEVKTLDPGQETILKLVFYQGLRGLLKQFGNLNFDTIENYDPFKIELRKKILNWKILQRKKKRRVQPNITGEKNVNIFCSSRGSNRDLLRGSQTLYRVAIKAGLYRKTVQVCIIPNNTTYFPSVSFKVPSIV